MVNSEDVGSNATSNNVAPTAADNAASPVVTDVPVIAGSRFADLTGNNVIPVAIFGTFIGLIIAVCLVQTIRKLMR